MIRVILDENDAAELLRVLYRGKRPARVHRLICLCGAGGDLLSSPKAWNGGQVLPHPKCPGCLATSQAAPIVDLYPSLAYERFLLTLERLLRETAGVMVEVPESEGAL